MKPVAVLASGLVTGVGFTSAATCAAVRAAVSNFAETRFYERGGRWLLGCTVPLDPPYRGRARLRSLLAPAVRECLAAAGPVASRRIPLLLCVAEPGRPGRATGLDDRLLSELQADLATDFHPLSAVLAEGRIGGARAAARAAALIAGQDVPLCLVAGVDSLLVGATIDYYDGQRRLLTSRNSDGFIPGEAGAAILLGPLGPVPRFVVRGAGFDQEAATITSEHPLRGEGLARAVRAAFADAGCDGEAVDYRMTDLAGEQYYFKEATLAHCRTIRTRKPRFYMTHPADCIGAIGAAVGPCVVALARDAALKGYAPGPGVLCHFANDAGERAALVLGLEEEAVS